MYIYNSKKSFWLSPLKSPAKRRLPMTIRDLEVWNSLGLLGEVKANTQQPYIMYIDGTGRRWDVYPGMPTSLRLNLHSDNCTVNLGKTPWLCFSKADIVRQMQNYEYQW